MGARHPRCAEMKKTQKPFFVAFYENRGRAQLDSQTTRSCIRSVDILSCTVAVEANQFGGVYFKAFVPFSLERINVFMLY